MGNNLWNLDEGESPVWGMGHRPTGLKRNGDLTERLGPRLRGGSFAGGGGPGGGDGPGRREGAKGRKEAPLQGRGLGLRWLKWGRDPVRGGEAPLRGLEPAGVGGGPLEQMRGGWGRGAGPGRYLSWVFIILGGSAQGGRRRRREWVGG